MSFNSINHTNKEREHNMPEVSRFFGILITMYFSEHMPPHFHAWYSGHKAEFDFDGNILAGEMPLNSQR